jgi:glutamyl-tRNA reductase
VHRYDIDDLQAVLDANLGHRQTVVPEVEALVHEGVENVTTWLHGHRVVPVIAGFRRKVEALADAEVEWALRRLDALDQHTQQVIVQLAHRIVNKLLHEPTAFLKAQAANGSGHTYAQALQELFGLDTPEAKICALPQGNDIERTRSSASKA